MPYLIDGHNLIPRVPGLSLEDMDDELKLIRLLQDYARVARTTVEVYFDNAAPGHVGSKQLGRVKAIFVSSQTIADERIIRHIKALGSGVKSWVVVSSDRRIQVEAKACRAGLMESHDFARQMMSVLAKQPDAGFDMPELSPGEVDEWLKIFDKKK